MTPQTEQPMPAPVAAPIGVAPGAEDYAGAFAVIGPAAALRTPRR